MLSLSMHLGLYTTWKLGNYLGWFKPGATLTDPFAKRQRPKPKSPEELAQLAPAQPPKEIPLSFIEVDPETATPTPQDAKHYSTQSTKAANPKPDPDSPVPKSDGSQEKVPRLETVPEPRPIAQSEPAPAPAPSPNVLQPGLAPLAVDPPAEEPPPPKDPTELALGDPVPQRPVQEPKTPPAQPLTPAKPTPETKAPTPPTRVRTLAQAREKKGLVGEQVRQDGGVPRRGKLSFDVKITAFSDYDATFISTVQQRWYDLLDRTKFDQRAGKVVLEFNLNHDGRISGMNVLETDVGPILGILCQRAVLDPSPFAKWTTEMRRTVGGNFRTVRFTFYYY